MTYINPVFEEVGILNTIHITELRVGRVRLISKLLELSMGGVPSIEGSLTHLVLEGSGLFWGEYIYDILMYGG